MWAAIVNFFRGNSTPKHVLIHALIVVGFLGAVGITARLFERRAARFAEGWRKDLMPLVCKGDGKLDFPAATPAGADEQARLTGQFQQLRQRISHHFNVMVKFYKEYSMTVVLIGVLAAIAAIALLFITSEGWEHANPYTKTIFLVATVSAAYSAAAPNIFQHEQNIAENRRLYLHYVVLANEMCSYAMTGETDEGTHMLPKDFIHYIDRQLEQLNRIAIGFDITKVPSFSEVLNKAKAGTPRAAPAPTDGAKKAEAPKK